jgi:hypothetical protein
MFASSNNIIYIASSITTFVLFRSPEAPLRLEILLYSGHQRQNHRIRRERSMYRTGRENNRILRMHRYAHYSVVVNHIQD